jgi:phosphatidylethanolamine-binding protein (PEBP) family uncharacterized protein
MNGQSMRSSEETAHGVHHHQQQFQGRRPGYGGPCPPAGDHPHRYLFTVFAVKSDKLDVKVDTSAAVVGFNSSIL